MLLLAQWREQPARLIVTVLAIALGVALGVAVFLVNTTALNEFGLATKRLVGESDLIVRGPREGFDEALFPALSRTPGVAIASPMLELEAALAGRHDTLKILGLDPFAAGSLQPSLLGEIAGGVLELIGRNGIFLSNSAARQLQLRRGDRLNVTVGSITKPIEVLGVMSEAGYPQPLGIMDIASAQWIFEKIGRLNRIDLRLAPGTSVAALQSRLRALLPPGTLVIAPDIERDRAVTVTRAYRINLNMLALVALWTGAFLVFSTQSLSVLRRRRALALLRALGVTRGGLQRALVGEGAALGALGSLLGLILGALFASVLLRLLAGDLGNGQLHAVGPSLQASALPLAVFFAVGTSVASAGAWLPARSAARQPAARALKGGDGDEGGIADIRWRPGVGLLLIGAVLAGLPAVDGLPIFGYLAIAVLLFGAVLLVPLLTVKLLERLPRTHRVIWNCAVAQLRENVGLAVLSLASIIVSFSLMVAMAIMVYSFRVSFEHWLGKLLPADLQIREPLGTDTAYWSPAEQGRLAAVPGIARMELRHVRSLLLDAARPAIALIARGGDAGQTAAQLPLTESARPVPGDTLPPAWISEALHDQYGIDAGATLDLPLAGREVRFRVAGIWRDYARQFGAVVISLPTYVAITGDRTATEGSIWLDGTRSAASVVADLQGLMAGNDAEITTSAGVRERSLQIFDRAFAITYALEAIAVLIGLTGVSFAATSTALARRSEFGMLMHIGMLRRQVVGILAGEGFLMSGFGVLYGLMLGAVLSVVLVYVVNRQSFNWSIDLAVPWWQLAVLSATLMAAAGFTAFWSGRAATSRDAVRAVREDW
jgi:putative ABC transport system permease protein